MKREISLIPKGYAQLEEKDAQAWKTARMVLELGMARVEAAEARVREHQNGLEAALLQVKAAKGEREGAEGAIIALEASLGIERPEDLVIRDGTVYRKVREKPPTVTVTPLPAESNSKDEMKKLEAVPVNGAQKE